MFLYTCVRKKRVITMSGNISADKFVKSGDITKAQFEAKLEEQQLEAAQKQKALSIFESYAKKTEGGAEDVLDVQEQQLAKAAFDALNTKKEDDLTKAEFDGAKSTNPDLKDADFDIYSTFANALNSVKPKEKSSIELAKEKFSTEDDVKKAVASYLLGTDVTQLHEDDSTWLKDSIPSGVEIQMPNEDNDRIKITYNGKEFIVHIVDDKVSIDSTDTENPTTLQQEILNNNESRDVSHNYLNKHGASGNSQSKYSVESGVISNTSTKRQHVNPAQTFAAMVLNDSTESTLSFAKGLKSEDVIAVITEDKESDGITLPQLLRYLTAVDDETSKTVKAGITTGSRTAAKDLDLDEKDMANIGIVFKKFAGDDGKLDKTELQNLINALTTKGTTMTSLARGAEDKFKHQHNTPVIPEEKDPDTTPVKPQPKPNTEPTFRPNRQRYIAGSDKKETVNYLYEDGMRTVIDENGHKVTEYNIAEYEDHGLLGAGKKDFIKIHGLPPEVRAEVVNGKLKEDMVIQVKDKYGNKTYYKVSYDVSNGTYKIGVEITKDEADAIKKSNKGDKTKVQEQKDKTSPVTPKGDHDVPEIDLDIDQSKLSLPKGDKKGRLSKSEVASYAQNDPQYIALCKKIAGYEAQVAAINKKYDDQIAAANKKYNDQLADLATNPEYNAQEGDSRSVAWDKDSKRRSQKSSIDSAKRAELDNIDSARRDELFKAKTPDGEKLTSALNIARSYQKDYIETLTNWSDTDSPKLDDEGWIKPAQVTLPDRTKAYRINGEYFAMDIDGEPGEKLTPEARAKHGITDNYVKSQYKEPSHDNAGATWFELKPDIKSYRQKNVTMYTRQSDNTIVGQTHEFVKFSLTDFDLLPVTTTYQADGKTKISEKSANKNISGYKYITSTKHYDASGNNVTSVTTNFHDDNKEANFGIEGDITENLLNSMRKNIGPSNDIKITSSEVQDKNGKTIIRYENKTQKFYTPDGAEKTKEQAQEIISKLKDKATLVQNTSFAQQTAP